MSRSRRPRHSHRFHPCTCLRCSIGDVKPGQRRREKVFARQDEAEAQDYARMGCDERTFYVDLHTGAWYHARQDDPVVEPDPGPPLTAPIGERARWPRNPHGLFMSLGMLVLASLLVACTPAPAWMPGDPPLEIWAPDDAVWAQMERGCAAWAPAVGLECARATDREAAIVTAAIGDPEVGVRAGTKATPDFGGLQLWELEYHVKFRGAEYLEADVAFVAAHEVGHVIGVWHHLDEPGCLMSGGFNGIGSATPTAADVDRLLEVWGMTEAEL